MTKFFEGDPLISRFVDSQRELFASLGGASVGIFGASGNLGTYFTNLLAIAAKRIESNIEIHTFSRTQPEVTGADWHHWSPLDSEGTSNFSLPRVDFGLFFAGSSSPSVFMRNQRESMLINSVGLNSALASTRTGFVYLSSAEIYSGLPNSPNEETPPVATATHPRATYIEGKRFGEALTSAYVSEGRIEFGGSARLALGYGPGFKLGDKRLLYELVETALNEGSIRVNEASASFSRSYIHLLNVSEVLLRMIVGKVCKVVNVGNQDHRTIEDISYLIASTLGAEVIRDSGNPPVVGAPKTVSIDTSEMAKLGLISRSISLQEGIRQVADWVVFEQSQKGGIPK